MKKKKICRNPDCRAEHYKTRLDCNDSCKNRFHYTKNLKRYSEDIIWTKEYNRIRREVIKLFDSGKRIVPKSYFEFMGLDFNFLKQIFDNEEGGECYVVNDLLLNIGNDDNITITKNNNKWES